MRSEQSRFDWPDVDLIQKSVPSGSLRSSLYACYRPLCWRSLISWKHNGAIFLGNVVGYETNRSLRKRYIRRHDRFVSRRVTIIFNHVFFCFLGDSYFGRALSVVIYPLVLFTVVGTLLHIFFSTTINFSSYFASVGISSGNNHPVSVKVITFLEWY